MKYVIELRAVLLADHDQPLFVSSRTICDAGSIWTEDRLSYFVKLGTPFVADDDKLLLALLGLIGDGATVRTEDRALNFVKLGPCFVAEDNKLLFAYLSPVGNAGSVGTEYRFSHNVKLRALLIPDNHEPMLRPFVRKELRTLQNGISDRGSIWAKNGNPNPGKPNKACTLLIPDDSDFTGVRVRVAK